MHKQNITNTAISNSSDNPVPNISEVKSVLLHNFSNKEISLILRAINSLYPNKEERRKLVFAKTTETSLSMKVDEWIQDTAEDHMYLLENPPPIHVNNTPSRNVKPKSSAKTTRP